MKVYQRLRRNDRQTLIGEMSMGGQKTLSFCRNKYNTFVFAEFV